MKTIKTILIACLLILLANKFFPNLPILSQLVNIAGSILLTLLKYLTDFIQWLVPDGITYRLLG